LEISSNTHKSLSESTLGGGREHLILSRSLIRRPVDEDQFADFSWRFIFSLISEIVDDISGLFSGESSNKAFPIRILRAGSFKDNLRKKNMNKLGRKKMGVLHYQRL